MSDTHPSLSDPAGHAPENWETSRAVDALDAIVYSDLFDCAATEEEIWRYSRLPIGRSQLAALLRAAERRAGALSTRDGLWCLKGREHLLDARPERRARAQELHRRAARVAAVLAATPFVRGLLLTGSAAADDAAAGSDLDLLVLVEPGRIGTVFAILGSSSRALGRSAFCPNHYISTDALAVDRHDIYVARELAQARPLAGCGAEMASANRWVQQLLPNAAGADDNGAAPRRAAPPSPAQRALEAPLRGGLGDRLERRCRALALRRLEAHHRERGRDLPDVVAEELEAGTQLRFHAGLDAKQLLDRHRRGRERLAESLAAADGAAG